MLRNVLIALSFFLLSACGGGGGDSSAGSSSDGNQSLSNVLTLSPSAESLTVYSGYSTEFSIDAQASSLIKGTAYVVVTDTKGVITTDLTLHQNSTYSYTATLNTSPSLTVGHHTGNLSVDVCKDPACNSKWGATTLLPYDFDVRPGSEAPPFATISPAAISETIYNGGETFSIPIQPSVSFLPKRIYMSAQDSAGDFMTLTGSGIEVSWMNSNSFTAQLPLSPSLGTHTGTITVHLCRDFSDCRYEMYGSPMVIPYTVKVQPSTNLTALSPWNNVDDWETYQGNAAHTGYIPATLDASNFSQRWAWGASGGCGTIRDVAIAGGLAFISCDAGDSGFFGSQFLAMRESDAGIAWQTDFGANSEVNPPAVSGGKVFVASMTDSNFQWSGTMNGYDASNGNVLFQTAFTTDGKVYAAPVVSNGKIYAGSSNAGGALNLYRLDGTTGGVDWTSSLGTMISHWGWTPAIDSTYAYIYTDSGLKLVNLADGSIAATIPDSNSDSVIGVVPVIASNQSVISLSSEHGNLTDFDTNLLSIKWTSPGQYETSPAVGNGVVYALNNSPFRLEARQESDGSLLWSWTPSSTDETSFAGGNVIATDNMILLSTSKRTYAINLDTHASVWQYLGAGRLALSANGVLYIASNFDNLYAINMK